MAKKTSKKTPYNPKVLNLENYTHPDKFGEMLGYRFKELDRKNFKAIALLEITEKHLSPAARVHGGVISALFDNTFGACVFTTLGKHDFCSTVELKVNYLKPLNLGDVLRCECQVIHRGKRLCVSQGFLYRNDEKAPVAMATSTFNIVSPPQSGAQNGEAGIPRTDKARSK
jgi:uncharacterized protein (TIGR00369 family)